MKLVENVDRFLDYPWGRVVYEATHQSLSGVIEQRVVDLKPKANDKDDRYGYVLMGFPYAFQVINLTEVMLELVRAIDGLIRVTCVVVLDLAVRSCAGDWGGVREPGVKHSVASHAEVDSR